jgi:NADH:ubiquinone oxidoreductase subunit 6 (subunit J)
MEEKIVQPWMKGLMISLVLIVLGIGLYLSGLWLNKAVGYIQYCIIIAAIAWCCVHYAKQMNGDVTFGNVFAHGFKITATIIVITAVYSVIAMNFLFPEMIDKIIENAATEMEKNKKLTDEQIKQALDMTRKFMMPFAIGGIIIMTGIIGAIGSAIGAALAKKTPKTNPF